MKRLIIALPLAFLLGACDTPETTPNDDALEVADDAAPADGERRGRGGKFAKLDADQDGSISQAEAQAHPRFAEHFAELDTDKDGKLTRDELHAMKGKFGGKHGRHGDKHDGKHGDWADKSPAERAAHKLEKFDKNGDKSLTRDELEGSRMADKFADIDTDKDGKLSLDELTAHKAKHHDKRGGPDGDKDGKGWHGKEWHGQRGDHDGKGWGAKSPEERADKVLARFDANADKVLTADELTGKFADRLVLADTDKDGKLTRDELIAFKPEPGKRGDAPAVR